MQKTEAEVSSGSDGSGSMRKTDLEVSLLVGQEIGGKEVAAKKGKVRLGSLAPVAGLVLSASAFLAGRWSNGIGPSDHLWSPQMNPAFLGEPAAKHTIRNFDAYLMQRAAFDKPETKLANVQQWLAPDFEYDTVGFPNAKSPADWCLSGEEQKFRTAMNMSSFTQMLFFGTDKMATTTSYGTVYWGQALLGVPAPERWITFRVTDFYAAREVAGKTMIYYNFMMIDFADLFRRAGQPVLPAAKLPDGQFLPPSVLDGVPAPFSRLVAGRDAVAAKAVAASILEQDWIGPGSSGVWSDTMRFYGPGGIGMAASLVELHEHVLTPFHTAFVNRTLVSTIFDCEGNYCGAFGEVQGLHLGTWLGLKASGLSVKIRFAMHWRIEGGQAEEAWCLFDVPGLFSQLGIDFFAVAAKGTASTLP